MRFFTNIGDDFQKLEQAVREYRAHLDGLRGRLTDEAFYFFADADVHDSELMDMAVVDGSRPAPLSEPGRPWNNEIRFPVRVDLKLLDAYDRFVWQIEYRGVRRIFIDFPTDDPNHHREGDGFGDWYWHELTAVDDQFLRHEVEFATGSILLFEFKQVEVSVREARTNHGYLPFFRPLSDWEKNLLRRLLEPDFLGRNDLLKQLETTEGTSDTLNAELGSLRLRTNSSTKASIPPTISGVYGQGEDADGTPITYDLHFAKGELQELLITRSGSEVLRHPDIDQIRVSVYPEQQARKKGRKSKPDRSP